MNNVSFRESLRALVPPWLSDRNPAAPSRGFRYLYSMAAVLDSMMEIAVEGMRAKYPSQGTVTALPYIGRDRRIIRGLGESNDAYAQRLIRWLDSWRIAGSARSVLEQLAPSFAPGIAPTMRIVNNWGVWYTLSGGALTIEHRGNWNWDNRPDLWGRCWVIFYSGFGYPWSPDGHYGDGKKWGDGRTWGTTMTRAELATLQAIVYQWRAAQTRYVNLIVAFDLASFNPASPEPDGTWGKFYKLVGGRAVPSRLQTARYFDDNRGGADYGQPLDVGPS